MADVDSDLASSLRQAKSKPMFFVFVAKGTEGKLLVDKKKISPKGASDAKKECGGGTVYQGRCQGEEGKLVFEIGKEPPPSLSALTKKIIKRDAGLTFDVEYRFAADLAADEAQSESIDGDTAEAELTARLPEVQKQVDQKKMTKPPSGMQRLNGLMPAIKAALAAGGPNVARIQTLVAGATGLLKKNDAPQADKLLDELEPLLKSGAGATITPAVDLGADFNKKLAAWTPDIKAAMTAKGPNAAAIAKLVAQATGLSKPGGDMVQALAMLTECHALSTQAAQKPSDDAAQAAEWERRVTALEPRVLAAQKTRAGEAKWMTMFMSAQDLGSEGDFAKSFVILDKLEELLSAPAKEKSPELIAALETWNVARENSVAKLQETIKVVLATKDPEAGESELELRAVIKQLSGKVETRQQAAEMTRYLEDDEVVADVSELAFDVKTPLLKVLTAITPALQA